MQNSAGGHVHRAWGGRARGDRRPRHKGLHAHLYRPGEDAAPTRTLPLDAPRHVPVQNVQHRQGVPLDGATGTGPGSATAAAAARPVTAAATATTKNESGDIWGEQEWSAAATKLCSTEEVSITEFADVSEKKWSIGRSTADHIITAARIVVIVVTVTG